MSGERFVAAAGALFGAFGIMLLAAAAHGGAGLGSAGQMLLGHAPALVAIAAASHAGLLRRGPAGLAALVIGAGVILFAADIALRTFAGHRLFPMAAPIGGSLAILGWAALAVVALSGRGQARAEPDQS